MPADEPKPSPAKQAQAGLLPWVSMHDYRPDQRVVSEALGNVQIPVPPQGGGNGGISKQHGVP